METKSGMETEMEANIQVENQMETEMEAECQMENLMAKMDPGMETHNHHCLRFRNHKSKVWDSGFCSALRTSQKKKSCY